MSKTTPYPGVPGRAMWGGYLYAARFNDGSVKVGCTTNPGYRLATHRSHAAAFGLEIIEVWLSPRHDGYKKTEKDLVAIAARLSSGQRLSEYFVGVDFAELKVRADTIDFPPVDEAAHRESAARRSTRPLFGAPRLEPEVSWNITAGRAIARLLGREGNGYSYPVVGQTPQDPDLPVVLQRIADLRGVSVAAVREMTSIDVLRSLLQTIVSTEVLELEMWARENGRHDLLKPLWPAPTPPDLRVVS